MNTFPEVDVIWWNATRFYVHCPFCQSVHRHGVNWNGPKTRISHCKSGEASTYRFCFPISSTGMVAYEIDKIQARYKNICVPHDEEKEDAHDLDLLTRKLAQKVKITAEREASHLSLYDDSKELVTINIPMEDGIGKFDQKRILEAIADCVSGDVNKVRGYLETSSEAQLFIQGRLRFGRTTLIAAAAEQSSAMVSLLIDYGADVDAGDNLGRTALMEASLFGRLENVKILLNANADRMIQDNNNMQAIDLARDNAQNKRERHDRTGGELTFLRDLDRQAIIRLLGGEIQKSGIVFGRPPTLSQVSSYYFRSSPAATPLFLYRPVEEYPRTTPWKTVARLERGGRFQTIGAMSGWSHTSHSSIRVNGRQWTDDVRYISEVVGHDLPPHRYDQSAGKPGEYNACHAEKQLIAYFIDRHVFLPRDCSPRPELEEEAKRVEDLLTENLSSTEVGRELTSLRAKVEELKYQVDDWDERLKKNPDRKTALQLELKSFEKKLNRLLASPQSDLILGLEARLQAINKQGRMHVDLIKMAQSPLRPSLTEAVILISSHPCEDCISFNNKVNELFGLSLQLFAAVEQK